MPISHTDSLFQLIKSLTKAEKRNFRLYAKRNHSGESLKFIDLFDIMDKQSEGDDATVLRKLKEVNKPQYANLKRHLYSQIVVSLRMIHKTKRANIQVREYLDFAYILYGKGLYLQALKLLQIAKREAIKHHLNYLHLTVVEFEKQIETRHITRSGEKKAMELVAEAANINKTISSAVYLSNLKVELHGMYLRGGHIQNKTDQEGLEKYFQVKIQGIDEKKLGVIERIYLYQSHVWYAYIQLDFEACQVYANKWVQLFLDNPEMIQRDVDLYMRGYHYLLTAVTHLRDVKGLEKYLAQMEHFRKSEYKKFNRNSQIISFLYAHSGRLSLIILNGKFEEGLLLIPKTLKRINRYRGKLDDHRILVFYFKMAWIFFGANKISRAIFYLNKIVNKDMLNLREDLQYYARLLFLMCHYEMGDYDSMAYALKSFNSFFNRTKHHNSVQISTLNLFKALVKKPPFDHKDIMKNYLAELELLNEDPFLKLSISYLDVISWLRAKIDRRALEEVVRDGVRLQ